MKPRYVFIMALCVTFAGTAFWLTRKPATAPSSSPAITAEPQAQTKPASVAAFTPSPQLPAEMPGTEGKVAPAEDSIVIPEPKIPFAINPKDFEALGYQPGTEVASNYPGAKAYLVRENGERFLLQTNQVGHFQRVYVAENEPVQIAVEFPDATPGQPVAVTAWDGGFLPNGDISEVVRVDDQRRVFTQFLASQYRGIHRIGFQLPGSKPVVIADIWVGEPNPHRTLE